MDNKKIKIEFPMAWGIILTIVFLVLKLTKVIAWKWIWILSPLWMSVGLAILLVILVGLILFAKGINHE